MKHPNVLLLEKIYSDFAKGDLNSVLAACSDKITFNFPGRSKISGRYDKTTFASGFIGKLMELSGGSLTLDIHDVLASDRHAVVLLTDKLTRNGKAVEYRNAHVWRFEAGKPVGFYEYPKDLYEVDAIWGG